MYYYFFWQFTIIFHTFLLRITIWQIVKVGRTFSIHVLWELDFLKFGNIPVFYFSNSMPNNSKQFQNFVSFLENLVFLFLWIFSMSYNYLQTVGSWIIKKYIKKTKLKKSNYFFGSIDFWTFFTLLISGKCTTEVRWLL